MSRFNLGLGLLSVGRPWGVSQSTPPSKNDAIDLITEARAIGVNFFDTAPAYGASEEILGEAINSVPNDFSNATVATKVGEHWIPETRSTYVDHSYDCMRQSIDRSLDLLGRIDILQIHKATSDVLARKEIEKVVSYARGLGIKEFGASVSDQDAAMRAAESGLFNWLQFPLNIRNQKLKLVPSLLRRAGIKAIINRPFAMGEIAEDGALGRAKAFEFLFTADLPPGSVILSGTSSVSHLIENKSSFESALNELDSLRYSGGHSSRIL